MLCTTTKPKHNWLTCGHRFRVLLMGRSLIHIILMLTVSVKEILLKFCLCIKIKPCCPVAFCEVFEQKLDLNFLFAISKMTL